jgi:hypothetical protein
MQFVAKNLGVTTADGEDVRLQYDGDKLLLTFVDWQDHLCEMVFREVLAFRWQESAEEEIRYDTTYEVLASPWLEEQARVHGVNANGFAHYKLCFNACGTLDIVALSLGDQSGELR